MGGHVLKTWSRTQSTIALSSGEAELYAITKAACHCMGAAAMVFDFKYQTDARINTHSTAALGMVYGRGVGRTRHLDVQSSWIQEKHAEKRIHIDTVDTKRSLAYLMTKHVFRRCHYIARG